MRSAGAVRIEGLRLPRFFFHIRDGDRLDPDPRGVDLPSLEAVHHEAARAAAEMLAEGGDAFGELHFEVADERGVLVLTFAFAEAAGGASSKQAVGSDWSLLPLPGDRQGSGAGRNPGA